MVLFHTHSSLRAIEDLLFLISIGKGVLCGLG